MVNNLKNFRELLVSIIVVVCTLVFPTVTKAQEVNPANISTQLHDYFDVVYGVDQQPVNGQYYYGALHGSIFGDPYYIDDSFKMGSVMVDSILFSNLNLQYDIYLNNIVLRHISINGSLIELSLINRDIDQFEIDGRLFRPIIEENGGGKRLFCEVIVEGHVSYYVLRKKRLALTKSSGTNYEYIETVNGYLIIGDDQIPIRKNKTLYKLYPELKKELKIFLRSARQDINKNKIEIQGNMVNYCNTLLAKEQ